MKRTMVRLACTVAAVTGLGLAGAPPAQAASSALSAFGTPDMCTHSISAAFGWAGSTTATFKSHRTYYAGHVVHEHTVAMRQVGYNGGQYGAINWTTHAYC
ncbi:MAG TPA: hypothetical protein VK453_02605 [Micromonosporaceae bacterium]|nr:hypothetical protein [Micromonosporaceae bacterium]